MNALVSDHELRAAGIFDRPIRIDMDGSGVVQIVARDSRVQKNRDGTFLPVYATRTAEEASALIVLLCKRSYSDYYIYPVGDKTPTDITMAFYLAERDRGYSVRNTRA